jgi:uncharacterized BrkB/YihY/UPF0761 family membrane protein
MDEPKAKPGAARVVLRRLVFGLFACTVIAIALLVGLVVLSATGLLFDPHGYGMFSAIWFLAILTPVALVLWLLHLVLRRRR